MIDNNPFGEPIYSYTRAQALADGVLVDLGQFEVTRQHWKYPIACTSSVWACIEAAAKREGHDLTGVLHDIHMMAKFGCRRPADIDRVYFKVILAGKEHTFKLHVGPGDKGEAVLTLMLPNED